MAQGDGTARWKGVAGIVEGKLKLSEIVFITFNKSSWLLVGSLIKFEKSSLLLIKVKTDEDCNSILSKILLSLDNS